MPHNPSAKGMPFPLGGRSGAFKESVGALSLSPDGKSVAGAVQDGTIGVWEVATGRELKRLSKVAPHLHTLVWATDGRILTAGLWGVISFDAKTFQELSRWPIQTRTDAGDFTRDGRLLVTGNTHFIGYVIDATTGKPQGAAYPGKQEWTFAIAFSPSGKKLAVAGRNPDQDTIFLSEPKDFKIRLHFEPSMGRLFRVLFSPDDAKLVTVGESDEIRLWDLATGKLIQTLRAAAKGVTSAAFTPDGQTIATGCGAPIGRMTPNTFEFSGRRDIPAEDPKPRLIQQFDVTGKELWRSQELKSWATHLIVTPDGKRLISGHADGSVLRWELPSRP